MNRKSNVFVTAHCAVSALLILFLFFCGCKGSKANSNLVCIKDKCFEVELAQTTEEQIRGLQFRESMGEDKGMLFIFSDSQIRPFWMKDTLIPLDMLWLDYAHRIVHIEQNVPPCKTMQCPSYYPQAKAMYVLEINAGLSEKYGFEVGDVVDFRLNDG